MREGAEVRAAGHSDWHVEAVVCGAQLAAARSVVRLPPKAPQARRLQGHVGAAAGLLQRALHFPDQTLTVFDAQ